MRKQTQHNRAHPDAPLPRLVLHGLRHTWATLALHEGIDIQVRMAPGHVLHDRYVIDDQSMLILGTNLNGIGLKQAMVISVGEDLRAAVDAASGSLWITDATL